MKKILRIVFIVFAIGYSFILSKNVLYDWDMFAYAGVVASYSTDNHQEIHEYAYSLLKYPSEEKQAELVGSKWRKENFKNPKKFVSHLKYYHIKPLYTICAFYMTKFGISIMNSLSFMSVAPFFLMLLLFYFWVEEFLTPWQSLIGVPLLFLTYDISYLARVITPDSFSSLLIIWVFYLLYQKRYIIDYTILISLLLLVFVRLDNLILVFWVFFFNHLLLGKSLIDFFRINFKLLTMLCSIFLLLFLAFLLLYDGFLDMFLIFTPSIYLSQFFNLFSEIRGLFLGIIIIPLLLVFSNLTIEWKTLFYVILTTVVTRIILFPSLQHRFFISYELVLLIGVISHLSILANKKKKGNFSVDDDLIDN